MCSNVASGKAERNASASVPASNSALIRTLGHRGVAPGGGSSTGSSPASWGVIEVAPASSSASSKGAGSAEPMGSVSCRNGIAPSLDSEPAFQVVDVQSAGLERGVVEDFLVQRNV